MKWVRKRKDSEKFKKSMRDTQERLRYLSSIPIEDLIDQFSTSSKGLTIDDARGRLDEYGENKISQSQKETFLRRLVHSFVNPFNIILIIIAIVTYITDVMLSLTPDYITVAIILSLVGVSGIIAFVQNQRSFKAVEHLSKLVSNTSHVYRDSILIEIPIEEIVPGDIIALSAGDMLPVDVRFISTKDTFIGQAALTGESQPIEAFSTIHTHDKEALTDIANLGFMGSNIISGSSTAIVLATGNSTYLGTMAKSLSGERAKNSFEKGVDSVSSLLVKMMMVMVPLIFLINGIFKGEWVGSLLFAISIAVGLTPEMLPVIMTSTLARGAVSMSKHKVIVRNLSAIQTLGEMDILCTDKTGTLTEDRIILEKYMNVNGEDDSRILRYAYLNSFFQTGLKNLLDLAIINRGKESLSQSMIETYSCIDEIPFDFSRRRMSVVLENSDGKRQLITKGAVEEILSISSYIELDGKTVPMDEDGRRIALETYTKHNNDGLRMIGVAKKLEVPGSGAFSVNDENEMILLGFIGFLDPPKESAAKAITTLREHGVRTVVITGDSEGVAIKVCNKVGVSTKVVLLGSDIENMNDEQLIESVEICDLFAKMSPTQKERVVKAFQTNGHTVGYMGDGINDALSLRQADVGISVDSAVDIAKESADIMLLEKDLMVLEQGLEIGRQTFGNIMKYIKMATSGNLGNMISVIGASMFLPFLPMLPVQILTQNLLCDFSQLGMPFDRVDKEYIKRPHKWDTSSIKSFMAVMGPVSSVFDIACFAILWWVLGANRIELAPLFHGGWFVFGTISQVLVIYMIRTAKIPFIQSRPSLVLILSTVVVTVIAMVTGFTQFAIGLDMMVLPLTFIPLLALLLFAYLICVQIVKKFYVKKFGQWI